ncbi:hypothetical protein Landi51_00160 [Colletotrichum acutatum]
MRFASSKITSVSYAAVPAKISPRLAFVVRPTHKANAIVIAHIMPTFADQLETSRLTLIALSKEPFPFSCEFLQRCVDVSIDDPIKFFQPFLESQKFALELSESTSLASNQEASANPWLWSLVSAKFWMSFMTRSVQIDVRPSDCPVPMLPSALGRAITNGIGKIGLHWWERPASDEFEDDDFLPLIETNAAPKRVLSALVGEEHNGNKRVPNELIRDGTDRYKSAQPLSVLDVFSRFTPDHKSPDRHNPDRTTMPPLALPISTGRLEYKIGARMGMEHIEALPDTGAQVNAISTRLAAKLRLKPKANTKKLIRLPTGVTSHRQAAWRAFPPGQQKTWLKRLLGNEKRRLHGLINGEPVQALPDTRSDIMAVSEAYALSRGFDIDRNLEHYLDVDFADGSEGFICGLVRGVEWTFAASQQSVRCDFYVIEDLCTDVVLNSEFIFGLDVFSAQSESLSELPDSEDYSELLLISLKSNGYFNLPQREDVFNIDLNSPDASNRQRVLAELNYRDEVDDLIDTLDPDKQEAAERAELRDEGYGRSFGRRTNNYKLLPD